MFNPVQMAMSMINQNPQIMNQPNAQQYVSTIQSGNANACRQLAENICKSHGVTMNEAVQQASQFFGIKM